MLIVNVFPDTVSRHISHILTGLSDLAEQKQIKLYYKIRFKGIELKAKNRGILFFEVVDDASAQRKRVCVDMMDSGKLIFDDRLDICDVYFKRSYDPHYLDQHVAEPHRKKIQPYGLYFACKSVCYKSEYTYLCKYLLLHRRQLLTSMLAIKRAMLLFKNPLKSTLFKLGLVSSFSYLVDPRSYESEPDNASSGNVMYFTRVWDVNDMPEESRGDVQQLNRSRLSLVRALKASLGERFTGGIMEDAYAKQECPDVVVPIEVCTRENYLQLMKKADICIATTGLYGSIGAKLPEYLAASRAILSEPLHYNLPEPLIEGQHIEYFSSDEHCIALCQELIDDIDTVVRMKKANHQFYQDNVKPVMQLKNRLESLFNSTATFH